MQGGWGAPAWCRMLSLLFPGLGQVRVRAWRAAVISWSRDWRRLFTIVE